ncbi:MAG: aminotransferase [Pseudomonadota bacterium]
MPRPNDAGREIWEADRAHHTHPWQHFESFRDSGAMVIAKGEGARITDANGARYFDAVGGLWCTNIGLGREEMADAIADQVRELAYASPFTNMTNEPAARLAAKLAELAPGDLNHVLFSSGGSTAVDSAYRLMQFYFGCRGMPEKKHVIARKGGYHGSTYASMSIGNKRADRAPEFDYITDTIHHVSYPCTYRAPDDMDDAAFCDFLLDELEAKIMEIGPDKVGAFFAEPVLGAGGVVVPPEDYHRRTSELCKAHDILYVSDEVVTGFGRLGHWFASKDVFDIEPDIITCAKGLSSGYLPIGATLYSDAFHEVISTGDADRVFTNGFTYSGHPVCCAAALKNIEIIERENLLAHAREVGSYFEERLQRLRELEIVGDVRGKKLMMCVENVANRETKAMFPEDIDIGSQIARHCDEMGLIVRPIYHLNIMSPPLIITRDDVDFVVETLGKGIRRTMDDLVAKAIWSPSYAN